MKDMKLEKEVATGALAANAKKKGAKEKKVSKKPVAPKKKVKRAKGMHIRHATSGGFIVKHDPMSGPEMGKMAEPEEHAKPDMAALLAHVQEHMGGEAEEPGNPY